EEAVNRALELLDPAVHDWWVGRSVQGRIEVINADHWLTGYFYWNETGNLEGSETWKWRRPVIRVDDGYTDVQIAQVISRIANANTYTPWDTFSSHYRSWKVGHGDFDSV